MRSYRPQTLFITSLLTPENRQKSHENTTFKINLKGIGKISILRKLKVSQRGALGTCWKYFDEGRKIIDKMSLT